MCFIWTGPATKPRESISQASQGRQGVRFFSCSSIHAPPCPSLSSVTPFSCDSRTSQWDSGISRHLVAKLKLLESE